MSMSTSVVGFKPPDAKWKKMKAVYDACKEAQVTPPESVWAFFGSVVPQSQGVAVKLEDTECCDEYCGDGVSGFEIDVTKLPKDVTVIRFVNSW